MIVIESIEKKIHDLDEYYFNCDLTHIYKKHRPLLVRIIETVFNIQNKNDISCEDLFALEEGLTASWSVVFYDCAGKYAALLEPQYPEIRELLCKLSSHPRLITRRNIVIVSELLTNISCRNEILAKAMTDKSKTVRSFAIDVIARKKIHDLIPEMAKQSMVEKDATIRMDIKNSISLMQNGYYAEIEGDDVIVWYRTADGSRGERLSKEDFARRFEKS